MVLQSYFLADSGYCSNCWRGALALQLETSSESQLYQLHSTSSCRYGLGQCLYSGVGLGARMSARRAMLLEVSDGQ